MHVANSAALKGPWPITARAAYRLSLLALVGDGQSEALAGPVAELARVRLALTLSDARRLIGRVAESSAGMLTLSTREGRDYRLKRETRSPLAPATGEYMLPSLSRKRPVVAFLL
ncbi:MAG: hypothetical protein M3461_09000 [Pseudomonadota bacterium]|nr:hypothetical protein [Pseudomonadota bacterium]